MEIVIFFVLINYFILCLIYTITVGSNTPAGYSRKENQRFVTSNSQYGSSISQNPSSATKRVLLAKRTPSAKQLASFCEFTLK